MGLCYSCMSASVIREMPVDSSYTDPRKTIYTEEQCYTVVCMENGGDNVWEWICAKRHRCRHRHTPIVQHQFTLSIGEETLSKIIRLIVSFLPRASIKIYGVWVCEQCRGKCIGFLRSEMPCSFVFMQIDVRSAIRVPYAVYNCLINAPPHPQPEFRYTIKK